MRREIVIFGHPALRRRATGVDCVDTVLKRLADDLLETMYDANGLGLAAQQIDETQALCVVDVPAGMDVLVEDGPRLNPTIAMPLVMFNPEIVARAGNEALTDEGCLSFPKLYAPVFRAGVVTVRFLNLRGQVQTCEVRGLLARAVQHELDHLAGVLFVDHVASARRETLDAQLQEMERTGRRQASL